MCHFSLHQIFPGLKNKKDKDLAHSCPYLSPFFKLPPDPPKFHVQLAEILTPFEPRRKSSSFMTAKREELAGLEKRDVFQIVDWKGVPAGTI